MPCSDGSDNRGEINLEKKVDFLTQMLCRVGTRLESEGINLGDAQLEEWMVRHHRIDALVEALALLDRKSPYFWDNQSRIQSEINHLSFEGIL